MNRLRYFCTIVQTGSLARAADLLSLSPAALSKAMKLLEVESGIELFRPSGRGILITPEGHRFSEKAQQILNEVDQLSQYAMGLLPQNKQLRLGSFEVFTTYLLGEIYQELADSHDLMVHELGPGKIEEALLERKIDLGISYIAVPHQDLDHLEMGRVKMGVFGRSTAFPKSALHELPFAVPIEPLHGAPTKAQGLDGWLPSFGPRLIRFKVTLMESAIELVRRGVAVAYLPEFVVDLHNQYVLPKYRLEEMDFPMKGGKTSPVYFIKRREDEESALMKKVARIIRQNLK